MIYIQKEQFDNIPHHFDCASAMYGAIESGQKYRLISYEDVIKGCYDNLIDQHLFVGSVEFMNAVFNRKNIKNVRVPKNSNRISETITLKEAHKRVKNGETLFIKPFDIKLFTGLILDGCQYSCLENLPEDTKVMAYKPFESVIKSEWRLYINRNNIIDSRNYSGDFKIPPNYEYALEIVKENLNIFPDAYTIDIGILENGENVVVEFNDMWAIGNYGMDNYEYLKLLKLRYFEIIRNK